MMNTRNRVLNRTLNGVPNEVLCPFANVTNVINVAKAAVVAIVLLFSSVSIATADWAGGVEGGAVVDDDGGNATRLRLKLTNNTRPLSQYVYADWLRADTGDSYELGYKPRYWFSEALYVFGEVSARQDKPRSIDREMFGLTGVGMQFISKEQQSLFAELGAGYRQTEYDTDIENTEATAVGRLGFKQVLADLISFELDADTNISDTISSSTAEAGIALRVPGGAIKYSYRTRRLELGDLEAVTMSDSFVSFNYDF